MYNNSMIAAVNATLPIVAIVAVDSILNFGTTVVIMKYLVEMNFSVQKFLRNIFCETTCRITITWNSYHSGWN